MLYGRQEIRVLSRDQTASLQQIGYVIESVSCAFELSVRFVFTHRNLVLLGFSASGKQIAWVLYGQASRAISIG